MTDEQPPTAPEADSSGSGIGALVARHRPAFLVGAIAVGFVLLGTGSVFAGIGMASNVTTAVPSSSPTPTVIPPRPVPETVAAAAPVRTCSIAKLSRDPRLMSFEGTVALTDGTVLFDRKGTTPARTGSIMKVLTAAAALAKLGPGFRISTTVVDGGPGQIVLVGHGDPTLSAGQGSVYAGAPQLSDLAKQAVTAYSAKHPGVPITQVVLDASYWNPKDKWDPSWKRSEQQIGYHSEVTALQVDGDRANPRAETSPRSTDPIGRAGAKFLVALHAADPGGVVDGSASTTIGTASSGSAVLGTVRSQPVKTLIPQMLLPSDNTLGEMLARIVSKASGSDGSAASLNTVIPAALQVYGVPMTTVTVRDGSGLSDLNAVPAATMAAFMNAVHAGKNNLSIIGAGLSVSGRTGSLASRFTGANNVARGAVWGKTGWIDTEYSLAGYIKAHDGTVLSYAFYAIGTNIKDTAKQAIDTLATGAYRCGNNLSNY